MSDKIKIREDAINVKKGNLKDHLECIDKQAKISFWYITIVWILFASMYSSNLWFWKDSIFLWLFIILASSYNILWKQVTLHTDMSKVFSEDYNKSYIQYLDSRYKDVVKKYRNASKLLIEKATINNLLFFMLMLYILLFIF